MKRPVHPLNSEGEAFGGCVELSAWLGANRTAHTHQTLLYQPCAHAASAKAL